MCSVFLWLSVYLPDLAVSDPVPAAEGLQVGGGADQHDLGEGAGPAVLEARDLLAVADAAAQDRLLCLWVVVGGGLTG